MLKEIADAISLNATLFCQLSMDLPMMKIVKLHQHHTPKIGKEMTPIFSEITPPGTTLDLDFDPQDVVAIALLLRHPSKR